MKSEEDIRNMLQVVQNELKENGEQQSWEHGFLSGQIDCLFWILEEQNE